MQTLIFFGKIKTLNIISQLLQKEGVKHVQFHGQLRQESREKNLLDFKAGKATIMLATDVAARGLHVKRLAYVVNYDFPPSLEQYVHRCGRAGRGGGEDGRDELDPTTKKVVKTACVYSFFTRNMKALAPDILTMLNAGGEYIDPNLIELVKEVDPKRAAAQVAATINASKEREEDDGEQAAKKKRRKKRKKEEGGDEKNNINENGNERDS